MREDYIDLLDLAGALLHRWWMILLGLIIGAVAVGTITVTLIAPKYQATSMIYISNKTTSITSLADLQIGSQLAVDFQIVATTREVVESVIDQLGLNMTYEQLKKSVEITNPSGSHILKIQATSTDPVIAASISNTLADELRTRIATVMNTEEPSMVERAVVPTMKSSPSTTKNVMLGGFGGALLVCAVLVVAYLMDDTIKTDDDVRKYLNLNTLAAIPKEREGKGKR